MDRTPRCSGNPLVGRGGRKGVEGGGGREPGSRWPICRADRCQRYLGATGQSARVHPDERPDLRTSVSSRYHFPFCQLSDKKGCGIGLGSDPECMFMTSSTVRLLPSGQRNSAIKLRGGFPAN